MLNLTYIEKLETALTVTSNDYFEIISQEYQMHNIDPLHDHAKKLLSSLYILAHTH